MDIAASQAGSAVTNLPSVSIRLTWLNKPAAQLAILIGVTFGLRLLLAASMGLGIDESYMVASGRHLQSGYYDHPPVAWWLCWAASRLAGSDAPLIVRLPFIGLFAVSTVLMYRLTARLFTAQAGIWAACVMNAIPVLSITTGTFVLPDGPLLAALLGMALCVSMLEGANGRRAWALWMGAGLCAGVALTSKYTAVLPIAGVGLYLLTNRPRGSTANWLSRPEPYAAAAVAALFFVPVIVWNARNGWISFAFQGSRAGGRFHPFGPVSALLGQAIVVLPWILIPLWGCAIAALRAGPGDRRRWLPVCLGVPQVGFFLALSPWSHVLPHWPAPGYALLLPLLGDAIATRPKRAWLRSILLGTGIFMVVGTSFFASEVHFNWIPEMLDTFTVGNDPDFQLVDWLSMKSSLASRGLLDRPHTVIAGLRWHEAAKIDYALGGRPPVVCLCDDPREYGLASPAAAFAGYDVILIATHADLASMNAQYGKLFSSIELLNPVMLLHAGKAALLLPVFLGRDLRPALPKTGSAK